MKKLLPILLFVPLAGCVLPAQTPPPPPPTAYSIAPAVAPRPLFSPEQLDQLLGSIALYPDPLLALMLPAATNASEIVLAARYLQAGGNPNDVEAQPWDDSVQSLARYPQIIKWMDENLTWTNQLGDAFANQPDDVMAAIQRLRSRAYAAGTLRSTPQQQVVFEAQGILILPAQPDVIYIPYYDPTIVYVAPRVYSSYSYTPDTYFNYSAGLASGWWLSYGLDWGSRSVWSVDRPHRERYWREHHRDWHQHSRGGGLGSAFRDSIHTWQPRSGRRPSHGSGDRDWHGAPRDGRRPTGERSLVDQQAVSPDFVGPVPPAVRSSSDNRSRSGIRTAPPIHRSESQDRGQPNWRDRDSGRSRGGPPPTAAPSNPPQEMGPSPAAQEHRRSGGPSAAPEPRSAPRIHRSSGPPPSSSSNPPSAPPVTRRSDPPPSQPPPAAAPAPAPAPQQPPPQQSSGGDSEERRRPPFVRPH